MKVQTKKRITKKNVSEFLFVQKFCGQELKIWLEFRLIEK